MNEGARTTIRALRQQLLVARREQNLSRLHQVEEGLRQLAQIGYRCCLVDYQRDQLCYYIRLLDYAQARLKAEVEFPIEPTMGSIQWLPLSHLADYDEVVDAVRLGRLRQEMAPFIHHQSAPLAPAQRQRALRPAWPERHPGRWWMPGRLWWYLGSGFVVLGLVWLIALHLGNGYY